MLFSSVQSSRSVVSDSLQSHESQHARPPCPSPAPGVHSNSTSIESVMLLLSNSKHYSKIQNCLLELQIQREEEERGRDLTQESYQGGRQGCFRLRKDLEKKKKFACLSSHTKSKTNCGSQMTILMQRALLEIVILSEEKYTMLLICVILKKKIQMNLLTKHKKIHRHRKQTSTYQRGKLVRDKLEVCD